MLPGAAVASAFAGERGHRGGAWRRGWPPGRKPGPEQMRFSSQLQRRRGKRVTGAAAPREAAAASPSSAGGEERPSCASCCSPLDLGAFNDPTGQLAANSWQQQKRGKGEAPDRQRASGQRCDARGAGRALPAEAAAPRRRFTGPMPLREAQAARGQKIKIHRINYTRQIICPALLIIGSYKVGES